MSRSELADAIERLSVADEKRAGYDRELFEHWSDADSDGCDTRREVLLEEAVQAPTVSARCRLSGGVWVSYYDNVRITDSSDLDVDHMVPLAEAWRSGAREWSTDKRERFANDVGDPRALVAVTASTNRSKSDQDPAEWMPDNEAAHCRYVVEWVAVKLRWNLSIDRAEKAALKTHARGCGEALTVKTAT